MCVDHNGTFVCFWNEGGGQISRNLVRIKGNLGESGGETVAMDGILPTNREEIVCGSQWYLCEPLKRRWWPDLAQSRANQGESGGIWG